MKFNSLRVYNTLSGEKEPFIPLESGKVGMYVCGPTTYNYIHLGNARPIVVFDTVRRYLEYLGYKVTYVQNFTDVDDKIIKRAREEKTAPQDLAGKYVAEYFLDADRLNVKRASVHPKVSEHIQEIIYFVKGLVDKGHAYELEGDVYFSIASFPEYGKLSKRTLDDLQAGARVEVDERKHHPGDFALWKKAKEGEPNWNSPWGPGRPGWHIECSAMSAKYLSPSFDIHAGGFDLTFPHHENEIAQSEALFDMPMAKYWMHNGFITVNEEKMSKSVGNFFLLRDILEKFPSQVVRFYLLSTHYRSPLDFDDEKLDIAGKGLERLQTAYRLWKEAVSEVILAPETNTEVRLAHETAKLEKLFGEAMNDDFNTALAIAVLFDYARLLNTAITAGISGEAGLQELKEAGFLYKKLAGILGLELEQLEAGLEQEFTEKVEGLIQARQDARLKKDYARADAIRGELKEIGIIIEDTPQGIRWRKK